MNRSVRDLAFIVRKPLRKLNLGHFYSFTHPPIVPPIHISYPFTLSNNTITHSQHPSIIQTSCPNCQMIPSFNSFTRNSRRFSAAAYASWIPSDILPSNSLRTVRENDNQSETKIFQKITYSLTNQLIKQSIHSIIHPSMFNELKSQVRTLIIFHNFGLAVLTEKHLTFVIPISCL